MINSDGALTQPFPAKPPPPRPEKRVLGLWGTIGFGALIIFVFFIAQAIVIAIALVFIALPEIQAADAAADYDQMVQQVMDIVESRLGLLQSIATIFSGIVGTGLILIIIKSRKGAGIAEYLGLNKLTIKSALIAIGSVILFLAIASGVEALLGTETNEQITTDIYNSSVSPVLFAIAVVIFAPLFEEAFFRGFLYEGLRQSRLGVAGAIIITSLVFSVAHSFQYSIASIIWILGLGLVMGLVRWKTNTLWSTFIMHAIVNLVATVTLAFSA